MAPLKLDPRYTQVELNSPSVRVCSALLQQGSLSHSVSIIPLHKCKEFLPLNLYL